MESSKMLQNTVYFLARELVNALILKGCIFAALLTNALLLPFFVFIYQ